MVDEYSYKRIVLRCMGSIPASISFSCYGLIPAIGLLVFRFFDKITGIYPGYTPVITGVYPGYTPVIQDTYL